MTSRTADDQPARRGLREQKQRETRLRIAETGLKLFLAHGYEGTTLDAVAEAAGISRRTFFSYFRSKEDILLAWQEGAWDAMRADLLKVSPDEAPLDAVRKTLIDHVSRYDSEKMRAIDRVMRASETLKARKQAEYAAQEDGLHATLCEVWRQPQRRQALRIVAMVSIGAMRLAIEAWGNQSGERPITAFLEETFAALKVAVE
ncbi:TetR family transcriptional regulator [Bordetella genomosp. 8]|uniref:TetR family transcriptional regulator n=1 Tax=Bordetella genomosp. 8 TaxID=1416806 RepID=A0A1W6YP07_9BORD|nr:TetR/AcrR family transcriptional regulator [Bordetella genomosp. 8]ARP82303.1 TetR family transcriptional regulator [Bordetella genomosp. 8]